MATSSLDIINQALVRIGAAPLASLNDGTAQSLTAEALYQTVYRNRMSMTPWAFALRSRDLTQIMLDPADRRWTDGEHVFQLPTGTLRVLGHRRGRPYQVAGDQIYTDCEDFELVYIEDVSNVNAWPEYFKQLIVLDMAAAAAIAITDSGNRATIYQNEARLQFAQAVAIDAQQVPPYVFDLMRIYVRQSHNPLSGA